MLLSQSITNFMEYQKINAGKKYGQELQSFSAGLIPISKAGILTPSRPIKS